ncbi:sensor domain-containing protein [Streptomyces sp. NPDC093224]|uniref:sensor histidine kinase n=1 Tax=Streptomyces sp. NPDC093224 TaxID=3155198 RepID=UPI00341A5CE3
MRIRRTLLAAARGLALALVSLVGSIVLTTLTLASLAWTVAGIGLVTTPIVLESVRGFANFRRVWAHSWCGLTIDAGYRPLPEPDRPGLAARARRLASMLRDPATWRELLWLWVDASAGFLLALLPLALLAYGLAGFVVPLVYGLSGGRVHLVSTELVDLSRPSALVLLPVAGAALLALALFAGPWFVRAHFRLAAAFLTPPKSELAARVAQLAESRHDVVDASAAELRRIERDLHDGAQARLVAMGMTLGTVEALLDKDPAKARELLTMTRQSSADALTELRNLVQGIHPPVLAERGLGDAVRALALRMPMPVEVRVELGGRAQAPVETAVYFAVSELLTNAVKHAGADRLRVTIGHSAGVLAAEVGDNGKGGAGFASDGGRGAGSGSTGLLGIRRRVGAFDGTLTLDSPIGGPTVVRLEIPCVLLPVQDPAG